jgi:hypothetical protein
LSICQGHAAKLPGTIRVGALQPQIVTPPNTIRSFAVEDPVAGVWSAYFHNYASHAQQTVGAVFNLSGLTNEAHEGMWVDPKTGVVVDYFSFFGPSLLGATIPNFMQDIVFLVRPASPVDITTTALPSPSHGQPYFHRITARGGAMPYDWSIVSGSLPVGMTLDPVSGVITGTPAYGGNYQFTV